MNATELVARYRADSAVTVSGKDRSEGWAEITLPFSTLTDKFVRVYVRQAGPDEFLLTDLSDLAEDEYETTAEADVSGPFLQGKELIAKNAAGNIRPVNDAFVLPVTGEMLTSGLFDMGQFIQLAVNLAYLSI